MIIEDKKNNIQSNQITKQDSIWI